MVLKMLVEDQLDQPIKPTRRILSIVIVAFFCACSTLNEQHRATSTLSDPIPPLIDAHTHTAILGNQNSTEADLERMEKEYLASLRRAGAVGAVALSLDGYRGHRKIKNAPPMIHCYGVRSRTKLPELERSLKQKEFGCIKIYLGYVRKFPSDPDYLKIYPIAQKFKVPVIFHTGDTLTADGSLKHADPMGIDEIAVRFRSVDFVIAHCGNPWIETAAEVAYKNPNVYLDLSAFLTGNLDERSPDQVEQFVIKPIRWIFGYVENPTKLLFGSDFPVSEIAPYARAVMKAIPREHWNAVFHDNAVRVFHFKKGNS